MRRSGSVLLRLGVPCCKRYLEKEEAQKFQQPCLQHRGGRLSAKSSGRRVERFSVSLGDP